jgi:hypothetical protein
MTWSEKLDKLLMILGAAVPLMSALASYINHLVREREAAGEVVSPALLKTGALLNVGAINMDKAVQLAKKAKASAKDAANEG